KDKELEVRMPPLTTLSCNAQRRVFKLANPLSVTKATEILNDSQRYNSSIIVANTFCCALLMRSVGKK
ncbi:hypothetical protein, partial [Staphylococcus pseudintermedius]|uniref:hypothetical protein n=1 Tax=Staphylococcus pseudintermedius TaxID=283734 RepID=UPI001C6EDB37